MSELIVPVDKLLTNAMLSACDTLQGCRNAGAGTRDFNDSTHFKPLAIRTADLVSALLTASASTPLLAVRTTPGARFDMASGTELARLVSDTSEYLRNVAAPLLDTTSLNAYSREHADDIAGRLHNLYGALRGAILRKANSDLRELSNTSVTEFLRLAAAIASGPPKAK